MKTKIVYVVASLDDDIYMEQAIVSAWSARYYNPDCHITMVCCQDTFATLNEGVRNENRDLFDEVIVKEFQPDQSMKERSRWIKTNLRNIVSGDLLFLDTDTIVCRDLSFIDNFSFDLGAVLDNNCSFDKLLVHDWVASQMHQIYCMDVSEEKDYFNSGVLYAKDTDGVRSFFNNWRNNWLYEIEHSKSLQDQQPLMKANIDMGHVITEMEGEMNCQVVASIRHLANAAIVHIQNNFLGKDNYVTPFHAQSAYQQIKDKGFSESWKDKVIHFKELFSSPSFVLSEANSLLWKKMYQTGTIRLVDSRSVILLARLQKKMPHFFSLIEKASGFILKMRS